MPDNKYYTLAEGYPFPSNSTAVLMRSRQGTGGLGLLQDTQLIETLAHFNRERIPERVVHAKAVGAYGEFEATEDCSDVTCASFLNKAGEKTPLLLRVSTVGPESGSADTSRDVHGWAMKMYTDEGNLDWVFNNTPVFFMRDPIKFPSVNRSHKRNPRTHLPDPNMSVRFLNAYSGHTYKFTKTDCLFNYIKIHVKSRQGVRNFTGEEATKVAGEDPDYMIRDMYEAIARKDFPEWDVFVQVMSPSEAENYRWNIFDMTKVWPHEDFPLRKIGTMKLNRNPNNYFTDIEQAAFSPSTMVPWFAASADRILQARLFAYPDAARYRLGVNYQQLPTNAAKVPVYCPFERDGAMRFDGNYGADPNYVGSTLQPTRFKTEEKGVTPQSLDVHTDHEKWVGEVSAYTSQITEDDFVQPAALWDVIGREPEHQDRVINNLAGNISWVESLELRRAVYALFSRVNKNLGIRLKKATEAKVGA
ncbi:hypothetical protein E8E15_001110 [Penicillium rubens]|nr:hypothetical protein E8E15_001110 [Penicillium rubens]